MKPSRNLWPLGIVMAFGFFILGTVALIAISVFSRTDLVAVDYYEQEIRYQGQLDRLSRAQQLPAKATAAYNEARHSILISLPREHANAGAQGDVHLYRPSAAGLDQRMELQLDAQGSQRLDAARLSPGLWKVRVLWTVAGRDYAIEETVIVGSKSS